MGQEIQPFCEIVDFAEIPAIGHPDRGIPKKTVLLITSRLAKVRETLGDQELDISSAIGNGSTLNEIWGVPEEEAEQYSYQ